MKRLITLFMVIGLLLTSTIVVSAGYPDPGAGKTNIFMQNLSNDNDANVSLVFTTGETGGTAGTYDTSEPIQPRSSMRLLYPNFPEGVPNNWAGAVEVSATEPLAAIVNILWDNGDIHAAGTYKGVDAPDTQAFLPLLAVRPDLQVSRITVQNTEEGEANITIHFYNRNGVEVTDPPVTASIPSKSEKTFRLDVIEPDFSGTSGLGSAYITADKKIAAVGTLHWGPSGSNASDAYSAVATGDTTLWVPGVFRRYNAGCDNRTSTACYTNFSVVTVQNLGDVAANVTVQFWKDDGTMTHQLTDTINPKASKPYNTAIKGTMDQAVFDAMAAALGDNWRGTIKVISDGPALTGICTYYATSTGVADTMIYSAIGDSEATTNALSFPATYRKRTGGADAQWSTTLIQNLSNTPGRLDIRFYKSTDGTEVTDAHAVIDIPANGSKGLNLKQQVDLPQASLDALGTSFSGAMYVAPLDGIRIVGETNILWDGAGRAAAFTGFPVP